MAPGAPRGPRRPSAPLRSRRGPGSPRRSMRSATRRRSPPSRRGRSPRRPSGRPRATPRSLGGGEQRPARGVVVRRQAHRAPERARRRPSQAGPRPPRRPDGERPPGPSVGGPHAQESVTTGTPAAARASIAPGWRGGPRGDDRREDAAVVAQRRGWPPSPPRGPPPRPRARSATSPASPGGELEARERRGRHEVGVGRRPVVQERDRRAVPVGRSRLVAHAPAIRDEQRRGARSGRCRDATLGRSGRDGGIGRRAGLKNPWASAREGSTPLPAPPSKSLPSHARSLCQERATGRGRASPRRGGRTFASHVGARRAVRPHLSRSLQSGRAPPLERHDVPLRRGGGRGRPTSTPP